MASINLLEDYYSLTSSGVFSTKVPIPTGANRFELWYKIDNYNYNPLKRAIISITFNSPDKSDTTGLSIRPVFNLCVSENTGWTCITFDLPQTVNELSWIVLNGEYTVTWELYVNTVEATVSTDKGLEYTADGKLNVNPSTAEDNELQTNSKTVTGAINEVFLSTTDAFNTFATSIKSKGGSVAEPVNKTNINNGILSIPQEGGGSSVEVTTPLFNTTDELFNYYGWVDVRAIANGYTIFESKRICILNTSNDYAGDPNTSGASVVRSDGYAGKASPWPIWDDSKDLVDKFGNKYRWVMYDTINYSSTSDATILYMYLDQATYTKTTWPVMNYTNLIMFDISDRLAAVLAKVTNYEYFCSNCRALIKLPDNLDVSNGTTFKYFCSACYSLSRLPDNLNTSKGINFNGFCQNCTQLSMLPENLDTSNGTTFDYFCGYCLNLAKLPENLNTSKGISFGGFLYNCHALEKLPTNLDVSSGVNCADFCYNCFSLTEIPEQLKFTSATILRGAFSTTRIRRIPPGLNTSNVTNFSGFCNYCRWLTDVTILDLSKTTSIPSMFVDCYLLPYDIVTKLKNNAV